MKKIEIFCLSGIFLIPEHCQEHKVLEVFKPKKSKAFLASKSYDFDSHQKPKVSESPENKKYFRGFGGNLR